MKTGVQLDFKELRERAAAGDFGPVRDHFQALDGFTAAQDMARLVDSLATYNTTQLWLLLRSVHRWQR